MPGTLHIRHATPADADRIADIYGPYVIGTAISFELTPPDTEEIAARMSRPGLPWLVAELSGTVVGYAYATQFRAREAYGHTAETTVYVDRNQQRSGIGRVLTTELLQQLRAAGYHRAIAGVTLPNEASVGLHEKLGFMPVGVFHQIGRKFDKWHDVGFWELDLTVNLASPDASPAT